MIKIWRCQLKRFYWTSQSKKKKKLFPRVADYFAVKFYFSNAFLNTVEPI